MNLSLPAVSRVSELISQQKEEEPSHTPTPHRDRVWQDFVAGGAFGWVNASAQPEASGEEVVQAWALALLASIALLRIGWTTSTPGSHRFRST